MDGESKVECHVIANDDAQYFSHSVVPYGFPLILQAISTHFTSRVRVDDRSRHTFIMVEQAPNAGNANDFSRR